MSASETLAAVPSARTPRVGQAKGMHASFKDFSKKCYTAAHADTHRMVGEALRKGVRHEEHENFRSVAGIYNSLGSLLKPLWQTLDATADATSCGSANEEPETILKRKP